MARVSADLWLQQARSDMAVASLFDESEPAMYCHAIAKYQQTVEKSLKGLLVALRDKGIVNAHTVMRHDLDHEMSVLTHIPANPRRGSIIGKVSDLMSGTNRNEIRLLCALAPNVFQTRNTEYPFLRTDDTWQAPCDASAFTREELDRFRRTATDNLAGVSRLMAMLARI